MPPREILPRVTARIIRPDRTPFATVHDSKSGIEYTIAEPGATYEIEFNVDDSKIRAPLSDTNQVHFFFDFDGLPGAVCRRIRSSGLHVSTLTVSFISSHIIASHKETQIFYPMI